MVAGETGLKLRDVLKHVVKVPYIVIEVVIIQLQPMMENGVLEMLQTFSNVVQILVQVNHYITHIELHMNVLLQFNM